MNKSIYYYLFLLTFIFNNSMSYYKKNILKNNSNKQSLIDNKTLNKHLNREETKKRNLRITFCLL
jgi:hypothetical protein